MKCLCFYHPADGEEQGAPGARARARAPRRAQRGRELLIEIIAGKHGALADDTVARVLERLYALGIKPDWWKLEPQKTPAAWHAIEQVVKCMTLTAAASWCSAWRPEASSPRFALAGEAKRVKGFAVGRTIFADAADQWLSGKMTDEAAVADMAARFESLVSIWMETQNVRAARKGTR